MNGIFGKDSHVSGQLMVCRSIGRFEPYRNCYGLDKESSSVDLVSVDAKH